MPTQAASANPAVSPKHVALTYALGFRQLLKWFSEPALLLTLVAMMAIAAGAASALGLPSLIWHDHIWVQVWAGSSLMFLALSLGVTGFLLDRRGTGHALRVTDLFLYSSRPAVLMALAVLFGWLSAPRPHHGLGVVFGLLPPALMAVTLWRKHRGRLLRDLLADTNWFTAKFSSVMAALHLPIDPSFPIAPAIHVIHALFFGLVLVLYSLARLPSAPAIAAVTLVLILANGVIGFLSFWFGRYGTLLSCALAIITLGGSGVHDAAPPGVEQVTLQRTAPAGKLLADDQALEAWLTQTTARRPVTEPAPPPLAVVATSGGGIRASLWTVVVLNSLDQRIPGFLQHIRIITGASGGMVGAAHYVSALGPQGRLIPRAQIADAAAQDSLSSVARQLLSFSGDRGHALEAAWEQASEQRLTRPFASLRAGEAQGWLPSLVFTPTIVEDGRRLLISNLDLGSLLEQQSRPIERNVDVPDGGSEAGPAPPAADAPSSVSGVQLFAGQGDAMANLKLSTAARMNATFPWVTSAIELPSNPIRRVVDAGYYDNYGVDVGSLWLHAHRAWLSEHQLPVILIQIRDGQEHNKRTQLDEAGPSWTTRLFSPLTAPLETFLSTREATMSFRNDELFNAVSEEATSDDPTLRVAKDCAFATAVFELPEQAPLSWYLDAATRLAMQASMPGPSDSGLDPANADTTVPDRDRLHEARDRNRKTLLKLQDWWTHCTR